MDKYVTSREWSEKLKAAGYPQSTLHCWVKHVSEHMTDNKPNGRIETRWYLKTISHLYESDILFAAPLSDELLEQVRKFDFTIVNLNSDTLSLTSDSLDDPEAAILGKNLVEVLAKFWMALHEDDYL